MAFGRKRDASAAGTEPARLRAAEMAFGRLITTLGIIGIGTALAAILGTQDVDAWIIGLAVSSLSAVLAVLFWSRPRR
jgi:hypothetical protein